MGTVLIVGRGLAAASLMHRFHQAGIEFICIGKKDLSRSSLVAAGIWNPIVFKRLTKSWMADELIPELNRFYGALEKEAGETFISSREIIRAFNEEQEEELWKKKSKNELDDYLDPKIYPAELAPKNLKISGNFGKVLNAGNIDLAAFLEYTDKKFAQQMRDETFLYKDLLIEEQGVKYQNISAKAIVFCEGWLVKNNPWFNWLPLKPAKGEILTVKVEGLDLKKEISTRSSFLFQTQNQTFRCGATYEWEQLDENPTEAARLKLIENLKDHTGQKFEVTKQEAGVRPSSIDRRPIIGNHPEFPALFVFNGLGTKGVMLAPYFSNKFVNFYLKKEEPNKEINLRRFYHFYDNRKSG